MIGSVLVLQLPVLLSVHASDESGRILLCADLVVVVVVVVVC